MPYADIPVVQVDRRIAMAGDEPDLFAEPQALALAPIFSLPCSSEILVTSTSLRPWTQGGPFSPL